MGPHQASHPGRKQSRFIALMALLALAIGSLFPSGYMLDARAGGLEVTLCTQGGNVTAYLLADGTLVQDGQNAPLHNDQSDGPCDFAFHSGPALAQFSPNAQPQPKFVAVRSPLLAKHSIAPGRGLAAPPPPKTGPPSQA
jgi:hypothetical protein